MKMLKKTTTKKSKIVIEEIVEKDIEESIEQESIQVDIFDKT